jgi:hypothetical protein
MKTIWEKIFGKKAKGKRPCKRFRWGGFPVGHPFRKFARKKMIHGRIF